ncbi:hypothetical protein IC607_02585 [Cellulomonas sp. JH27-2]|uniref:hypothetical protein n=1 Tax=Cellulomonas sp. JH27-2 TaxID=2774139 RepID=UPI00177EACF2|nr:hypothetical protein [Cellulomonas sp. JH27-2]MBD8057852.1 hypothetical protein [Cellulomonas sp. JH27-2]
MRCAGRRQARDADDQVRDPIRREDGRTPDVPGRPRLDRLPRPATISEPQHLIDTFVTQYNQHRPHRSLPHRATPATAYTARPKATPGADRNADTHDHVRTDRVSKTGNLTLRHNGRLHHIGIGRTHAGTYVHLLVEDLDIRIINATTGEILRELTLDPTRDYQPQTQKRTPEPTNP